MTSFSEGSIRIALSVAEGVISGVRIDNGRILAVGKALCGNAPADAARLATQLFSVCRVAQGIASAEAVEHASGLAIGDAQAAARRFLLRGEGVLEHASRACLDWPALLGETPDVVVLRSLRKALADLHRDLYPENDWMTPGGGRLRPDRQRLACRLEAVDEALREGIFGNVPPVDAYSWWLWAQRGHTAAARLVARLMAEGLAELGASNVGSLGAVDRGALESRLAPDADMGFVARPDWLGTARETGPLARQGGHLLVEAMISRHGRGMMARLAAQLVELVAWVREMQDLGPRLCNDNGTSCHSRDGNGLGVVEAARGLLVHRIEIKEARVARYQILAPTEWNFHPDGPLARGLIGVVAGDDPARLARLLATALDPCVAYSVQVA